MNLAEREALLQFINTDTPLSRALGAFVAAQTARYQADCAQYMASVPRDTERASDAAAKADAYACWANELAHFAQESAK